MLTRYRSQSSSPSSNPPSPINLSIIYKVKSSCYCVKDQLLCLSSLVHENFPPNFPFEIICVVNKNRPTIYPHITSLSQSLSFVFPILAETTGIRWFINGFIVSRGAVIVDARFLASQLDFVKTAISNPAIVFVQPNIVNSVIPPRALAIPIAFSRKLGEEVWGKLHFLTWGWRTEIQAIVRGMSSQIVVVKERFGKAEYSRVEGWVIRFLEFLVREMVRLGLWNYRESEMRF
jgi:hypothetical protein